ncbi:type II toxin-antitoxin system Phd/YefM family antitoxin [Sulfurovum sp. bin170]|uniref:type II toxin-antitoxin system Phd/YefM family antitoxin n=1 Tax=Sulfurovum sp. bin170 TaxID=2695268 RepID=UPI0013DF2E11|nr:type II toxin-antitoxin system Phd/YefM family antitoxin [Sulfurovum sp. bin170]NEW60596.1 type II toxin-antitoxin system Phd/YefM family antitoxin [Sulfurovum sp. bin170]
MQVINYSYAEDNLESLINTVCDDNEKIIITTQNNKSVVMLSLDKYNNHAKIKRDVAKAIKEIERGDYMSIDEAFEKALLAYR